MVRTARDLFDQEFLRSLAALRILARRVPPGGRLAEQPSAARGAGAEFTDVRPYVPGDDLRTIDWNLLLRFDRAFVRLFLHEEDLPVHLLIDHSRSMGAPHVDRADLPDKLTTALRAAAALAFVATEHLDRVDVTGFDDRLREARKPGPGNAGFHALLAWLAQWQSSESTDLVRAMRQFASRRMRRGLLIIVSDFLDPAGAAAVLDALRAIEHSLLLVHVAHPGEERPELRGELELEDSETGERVPLFVDDAALDRFAAAYREHFEAIESIAKKRRGRFLRVFTDRPIATQIASAFDLGVLSV
ncbi:MAG: DUF58 domain-containing protein [Planctomycetota bacterium]